MAPVMSYVRCDMVEHLKKKQTIATCHTYRYSYIKIIVLN